MLKKALQGAISASMLLNGMIVYTPIVLNAQENKAKSTQTQNVLSLEFLKWLSKIMEEIIF